MALEAIPNHNNLFNMMVSEALYGTQYAGTMEDNMSDQGLGPNIGGGSGLSSPIMPSCQFAARVTASQWANLGVRGRNKRRRRPKVSKNKQDVEMQRMTHIAVERNRRKQMNEHLAVLRSLMLESYAERVGNFSNFKLFSFLVSSFFFAFVSLPLSFKTCYNVT